jgi:hypothetical protein
VQGVEGLFEVLPKDYAQDAGWWTRRDVCGESATEIAVRDAAGRGAA